MRPRRPTPSRYRPARAGASGTSGTSGESRTTPFGTTVPPVSPWLRRRSSMTNWEGAVTSAAAARARRRAARSSAERANTAWSSATVSPCEVTTSGVRKRRCIASAYAPFGPKHCTCRRSGANLRRASVQCRHADGTARRNRNAAPGDAAGSGVGRYRTVTPSTSRTPSDSPRSTVQTSTSTPPSRSSRATWRTCSSTPPTYGAYEELTSATRGRSAGVP